MSNGLGAGFFGLTLLAVLLGLAALQTLSLVGLFLFRRRNETIPHILRYASAAMLAGVLIVGGFGVLVLYDEAATLAFLFITIVVIPLVAVGLFLQYMTEMALLDTLATTGMAWSLPFLVGVVVTFGLTNGVNRLFDLAPAESQQLGLYWIASIVGGIVVVVGAFLLSNRVRKSLSSSKHTRTTETTDNLD